jgi:vacuolar-type H+-ATPase subunit I/STV1
MLSFGVFNTFYADFILSLYFKMIDILFPEEQDAIFMGLNIFAHDFIHDFNTVKFSDRMAKIGSEIDKLRRRLSLETEFSDTGSDSALSPQAEKAASAASDAKVSAREAGELEKQLKDKKKKDAEIEREIKELAKETAKAEEKAERDARRAAKAEKAAEKAAHIAEQKATGPLRRSSRHKKKDEEEIQKVIEGNKPDKTTIGKKIIGSIYNYVTNLIKPKIDDDNNYFYPEETSNKRSKSQLI